MFLNTFQPAEIIVLNGIAGAGEMAPPTSTRISARMKRVQEHSSAVNVVLLLGAQVLHQVHRNDYSSSDDYFNVPDDKAEFLIVSDDDKTRIALGFFFFPLHSKP